MNSNLKEMIIQHIRQAQANGWRLIWGKWGYNKEKCACALGCMLANRDDFDADQSTESLMDKAAQHLSVGRDWITGLIRGFDDSGFNDRCDKGAFLIGKEIREEMQPKRWTEIDRK